MKKITITFFILAIAAVNAFAQITITPSYNPTVGDRFVFRSVDTTNVQPGNSGANQNWNFSSIIIANDSTVLTYVSPSSTPNGSSFPSANVAQYQQSASAYTYYQTSSSQILNLGTVTSVSTVVNSNSQIVMQYPFTYNTNFTDVFQAQFTAAPATVYRRGTMNVTGDAYGTITLPTGTYSNVLRVKQVQTIVDSSVIGIFGIVTTTSLTTYSWFNGTNKFPLFQITNSAITTLAGTTYGKMVTITNSQPVGISQISTEVPSEYMLNQNYPNPFNPSTKISFEIPKEGFVNLTIFDNLGREVKNLVNEKLNAGAYETNFDASGLTSGIYFYRISAGNFVSVKKMTLIK